MLAREAYARANGLIAEVDSQIRAGEAVPTHALAASSPLEPGGAGPTLLRQAPGRHGQH